MTTAKRSRVGRTALVALGSVAAGVIMLVASPTYAGTEDKLVQLLIQKGLITREEYEAIKKEAEAAAPEPSPPAVVQELREAVETLRDDVRHDVRRREREAIATVLRLESEGRWRAHQNIADKNSGSTETLFLRRASVGLEAKPFDWVTARLVLTSEFLGADETDQGGPAGSGFGVDEGSIRLKSPDFPLYGVFGFRTQPFGVFFQRIVTDPMTQDAYEVKQVGATIGWETPKDIGKWEWDFSATVYRGEQQMTHLFDSRLFDSTAVVRSSALGLRSETDKVRSFILNTSVSPWKSLVAGTAFLSEPGDGRRNDTAAVWGGYSWTGYSFGRVAAQFEFAAALARERYVLQATGERLPPFREKILSLGVGYAPIRPVELSARLDRFWDDGLATAAKTWSVSDRLSAGGGYTVWESDETVVRLLAEYRLSAIRRAGAAQDTVAGWQNEVFLKIVFGHGPKLATW